MAEQVIIDIVPNVGPAEAALDKLSRRSESNLSRIRALASQPIPSVSVPLPSAPQAPNSLSGVPQNGRILATANQAYGTGDPAVIRKARDLEIEAIGIRRAQLDALKNRIAKGKEVGFSDQEKQDYSAERADLTRRAAAAKAASEKIGNVGLTAINPKSGVADTTTAIAEVRKRELAALNKGLASTEAGVISSTEATAATAQTATAAEATATANKQTAAAAKAQATAAGAAAATSNATSDELRSHRAALRSSLKSTRDRLAAIDRLDPSFRPDDRRALLDRAKRLEESQANLTGTDQEKIAPTRDLAIQARTIDEEANALRKARLAALGESVVAEKTAAAAEVEGAADAVKVSELQKLLAKKTLDRLTQAQAAAAEATVTNGTVPGVNQRAALVNLRARKIQEDIKASGGAGTGAQAAEAAALRTEANGLLKLQNGILREQNATEAEIAALDAKELLQRNLNNQLQKKAYNNLLLSQGIPQADGSFKQLGPYQRFQLRTGTGSANSRIEGVPPTALQAFQGSFATTARFAASGALLYGGFSAISSAVKNSAELEKSLSLIRGQFESIGQIDAFGQFKKDLFEISKETGVAAADIAEIGFQIQGAFGDQGQEVVRANIENAAKLSQVTGLDNKEIVNSLTAVSLAFDSSFERIGDVSINLQDRFGVKAKETIDFLGQIAPVAQDAGFSLEQIGTIAAIVQQKAGRAGAALAEGLGRVIPAVAERQPELAALSAKEKALQTPEFYKAIASGDIAQELIVLSQQFGKLGKESQQYVINLLGGRREAQLIIPLFNEQLDLVGEINKTQQAKNELAPRFKSLKDSLSQQLAELSEAAKQFGVTVYESGIDTGLKSIVQSLGLLVGVLNPALTALGAFNDFMGGLPARLLAAAVAVRIFRAANSRFSIGSGLSNLTMGGIGEFGPIARYQAARNPVAPQPIYGTGLFGGQTILAGAAQQQAAATRLQALRAGVAPVGSSLYAALGGPVGVGILATTIGASVRSSEASKEKARQKKLLESLLKKDNEELTKIVDEYTKNDPDSLFTQAKNLLTGSKGTAATAIDAEQIQRGEILAPILKEYQKDQAKYINERLGDLLNTKSKEVDDLLYDFYNLDKNDPRSTWERISGDFFQSGNSNSDRIDAKRSGLTPEKLKADIDQTISDYISDPGNNDYEAKINGLQRIIASLYPEIYEQLFVDGKVRGEKALDILKGINESAPNVESSVAAYQSGTGDLATAKQALELQITGYQEILNLQPTNARFIKAMADTYKQLAIVSQGLASNAQKRIDFVSLTGIVNSGEVFADQLRVSAEQAAIRISQADSARYEAQRPKRLSVDLSQIEAASQVDVLVQKHDEFRNQVEKLSDFVSDEYRAYEESVTREISTLPVGGRERLPVDLSQIDVSQIPANFGLGLPTAPTDTYKPIRVTQGNLDEVALAEKVKLLQDKSFTDQAEREKVLDEIYQLFPKIAEAKINQTEGAVNRAQARANGISIPDPVRLLALATSVGSPDNLEFSKYLEIEELYNKGISTNIIKKQAEAERIARAILNNEDPRDDPRKALADYVARLKVQKAAYEARGNKTPATDARIKAAQDALTALNTLDPLAGAPGVLPDTYTELDPAVNQIEKEKARRELAKAIAPGNKLLAAQKDLEQADADILDAGKDDVKKTEALTTKLQAQNAIVQALTGIAKSRISLAAAITDDPIQIAQAALDNAELDLNAAIAASDEEAANAAREAIHQAQNQVQDGINAVVNSQAAIASALSEQNPLAAAQNAVADADRAITQARTEADKNAAIAQKISAQHKLQDVINAINKANSDLLIAMLNYAGEGVKAADEGIRQAERDLSAAVLKGDTAGIRQAQIALINSRLAKEQAIKDAQAADLEFANVFNEGNPIAQAQAGLAAAREAWKTARGQVAQIRAFAAILEQQKKLEDAMSDLRKANEELAQVQANGDARKQAELAVAAALAAISDARGPAEQARAQAAYLQAQQNLQAAIADESIASLELAQSNRPGDSLGSAYAQLAIAQIKLAEVIKNKGGKAELARAQAAVNAANAAVKNAIVDTIAAQFELAQAVADAAGDIVGSAQAALASAQAKLAAAQASGGSAEIARATADVVRAQAAVRDAQLQDQQSDIDFALQMEQITTGQAIAQLEALLQIPNLTKQETQQLLLKIKQLRDSLGQDLQFNIPSFLGLPTLYEARRLNQSGGASGYQDQRVYQVTVYPAPGMDEEALANKVVERVGGAMAAPSGSSATFAGIY